MNIRSASTLLAAAALLSACADSTLPTAAPRSPQAPAAEVSHWPTWGTPGFWFTFADPPEGGIHQPFDDALSPTVEVCKITGSTCGPILATFTRTSGSYGRLVTVDAANEEYRVVWPTGSTGAHTGDVYRVSVRVGQRKLGFMDVKMVGSIWEYFGTDTSEFYPWFAGYNLTVAFHIEQGIPGSFTGPTSITVGVGEAVAFAPTVKDLHGQTIVGAVPPMNMDNPAVAMLDSGLVVGVTPGTTQLGMYWWDLVATVPVTVTDNRRAWTAMTTPDAEGLRGLWGSSASNVYAGGNAGVLRWDGTQWSYLEPLRWRSIYGLTGFSASDVWAVGDGGVILRYNGAAWSGAVYDGTSVAPIDLTSFDRPAKRIALRGVWGSSSTNVLAVGDSGTMLRYDGTQYTRITTPTTATLTGVWGSSATNAYATTADGRILRYNGSTVSVVAGVQAPGALLAVWGSSASNVYAVGEGGIVFRYNGTSWQRVRLPTRTTLYTVWGSGANEVYAAGSEGAIYRWDGTKWTPEKRAGGGGQFLSVWGTGGNVYAAGGGGMILKR